jgi:hypothetical protein
MAETVYVLCAVTSITCAVMLLRGFFKSRTQLLFWSSLCFAGLAINNVLLFVDLVLTSSGIDLSLWRTATALTAVTVLLFGLVWESR